jgi:hypothetical protein
VKYYRRGGINHDREVETPHLYPGHHAAARVQEKRYGADDGKVYFVISCAECNYGLCKHIEIYAVGGAPQNIVMVDECPRCREAREKGEPVEKLQHPVTMYMKE